MGAAMSSPIDEEKMKGILEGTLGTFGQKYTKSYSSALVSKVTEDARKEGESDYKLLSRPEESASKEPIKTGWATKEGAIVKSWKKRFFVVRYDYKIEYYDKEETFKSGGAPKGTINPAGYTVSEDPSSELAKRLQELSLKLKMDLSSLPKPKQLPANTVGLLRDRRRDWYIQFDSPAQLAEWLPVLTTACKKAKGLNSQDPVAIKAYNSAFNATRISRGYGKDTKSFNGSEEQNLSDLIVKQLEGEVLPGVYGKIESEVPAGKMRSMAFDKLSSTIDTFVSAGVSTGWNASSRAVESARPSILDRLQPQADKIVAAQDKVRAKIRSIVSPAVDKAVTRVILPVADTVLGVVMGPVNEAYRFLLKVFQEQLEKANSTVTSGGDENTLWKDLAKIPKAAATFAEAVKNLEIFHKLLEKAEKLGSLAPGLSDIISMISTAESALQDLLDKAFYTLQTLFQQATKDGKDKATAIKEASAEVTSRLNHDIGVSTLELGRNLLATFTMPPIKEEVVEPAKGMLAPVDEEVPDFLKDIVNLEDDLDATVEDIVNDALDTAVKPSVPTLQA